MDTSETNESPVEEAGATASPDTDSQVATQPVETEGGVSDAEAEEAGEALLAGKYKSPQELEKAYKELEGKLGDLGQKAKLADVIQQKYGVTPEQLQAQIEQQERQAQMERYQNDPQAAVFDRMNYLEQRIAQQEHEKAVASVNKEVDDFIKSNPAYEKQKDLIKELSLTPGIGYDPQTGQNLNSLDDIARKYFGDVRAQGQQDAYQKIEKKVLTGATGASQAAPKGKLTLDDMKNMSSKDLEAILPWADTSNRA